MRSPERALWMLGTSARTSGDGVLLGVTSAELVLLAVLTPTFTTVDWIYISQHLLVLGIALTRRSPKVLDRSLPSNAAVIIAHAYPYAQVAYLRWIPGAPAWPSAGLVIVTVAACSTLVCLLSLGRSFGIRPAWRDLTVTGPYRLVRHPMYLSYVLADIGYNLQEWNFGTVVLVIAGWAALVYRIRAEERVLARDGAWAKYLTVVSYRLLPRLW